MFFWTVSAEPKLVEDPEGPIARTFTVLLPGAFPCKDRSEVLLFSLRCCQDVRKRSVSSRIGPEVERVPRCHICESVCAGVEFFSTRLRKLQEAVPRHLTYLLIGKLLTSVVRYLLQHGSGLRVVRRKRVLIPLMSVPVQVARSAVRAFRQR